MMLLRLVHRLCLQVGMKREHPPSGWGAPMVPDFKPHRTLSIVQHSDMERALSSNPALL
jgi:hypothetical protein